LEEATAEAFASGRPVEGAIPYPSLSQPAALDATCKLEISFLELLGRGLIL
jgi:hypothetical protein